jgi:hypothetical protein
MRKSSLFFWSLAAEALLLCLLFMQASFSREVRKGKLEEEARMVEALGLTDLCLFTDARYARHPSQADLSSAFQDHPMSLEHFPSGSFTLPPEGLMRRP